MALEHLVDDALTPIKLLLDIVPPLLRKRAAAALSAGDKLATTAHLQALGLELESLLLQLNATIEGFLFLLASRLKGKQVTAAYTKSGRAQWLADLEIAFTFEGAKLSGWQHVDVTRTDSNLLKHRLGIEFIPGTTTPLDIKKTVDLTEAIVLERFLGVRQWMLQLVQSCKPLDQ